MSIDRNILSSACDVCKQIPSRKVWLIRHKEISLMVSTNCVAEVIVIDVGYLESFVLIG